MWPFFLIHTHETVRKLRVSPKAVLNLLHGDPERFFRLSPLVASVAKNADPHSYTIVETIPVLGLMAQTTFTVIVRVVKDGVENDIVAGLGTRSKNTFHVRKSSEDDTCELVHHTTTRVCLNYLCLLYSDRFRVGIISPHVVHCTNADEWT